MHSVHSHRDKIVHYTNVATALYPNFKMFHCSNSQYELLLLCRNLPKKLKSNRAAAYI